MTPTEKLWLVSKRVLTGYYTGLVLALLGLLFAGGYVTLWWLLLKQLVK